MVKNDKINISATLQHNNASLPLTSIAGADPGFSKGGAKLTQWRRMRHLSLRTRMYGLTLLQKFFVTPPIFASEEQKKKKRSQPTTSRIMDHHLTFW